MIKIRYFAIFFLITFLAPTFLFAETIFEIEYRNADAVYQECYKSLSGKIKASLSNPSARGWRRWSMLTRIKVERCFRHRRVRDDFEDMQAFSDDLKKIDD